MGQIILIYVKKVLTAKWTNEVIEPKPENVFGGHLILQCLSISSVCYRPMITKPIQPFDYNIASVMVYSSQHIK